ncbi:RNA methyltransferase, TrmH family, group 1 [Synechococcus sp. PCC 7502]|uniref:RNA methyltransferase n=1 Tax=Synechococcus sp. PCC 7502 TaxID=1173263 RepID=UPI00029FD217|nr:RNA methyltransferase [Synechococcus sp. PCC 7502]AFY72283.1 RNA methyltransferase, TrmH family, group 1 [Synechococcus sp. PCC 7502]
MLEIRIILVEPSGALNVGSIARVMKNMGLSELWLVNPKFDLTSDRYAKAAQDMAVHAQDILDSAKVVDDLPQALGGCQRAIATTGRTEITTESPEVGIRWLLGIESGVDFEYLPNMEIGAIVFGREDRGLTNAEIAYCQKVIQIPVSPIYPSINLAQAVAICCYQLQILLPPVNSASQNLKNKENTDSESAIACLEHLEAYYQDLEAVLLKIGYLFPHTSFSRMQKLRHLFNKANLTKPEIDMLRGIIRQINWAAQEK